MKLLFPKIFLLSLVLCSFSMAKHIDKATINLLGSNKDSIKISSSDTSLVSMFNWAHATSNGYLGKDSDPVGPWYEAALPEREAFCIRDISHQCIGAEIISHGKQNLNMYYKFVSNITENKDWCTYWEINRYNQPAPIDYTSDKDFWYNLNANFDIINASYKLYQWTGNKAYINDPLFDQFFKISLNQYIDRWQLQSNKIMQRAGVMNVTEKFEKDKRWKMNARGLPSYDESVEGLAITSDLIAMIYNGFSTYAKILALRGELVKSKQYEKKALAYRQLIENRWWNEKTNSYYNYFLEDGKFHGGGSNLYMLWYGVIQNPKRIIQTLGNNNIWDYYEIEGMSYLPQLFYRFGYNENGYRFLQKIYSNKRRQYPEASSGCIEGIVHGLMGVQPSAAEGIVTTCPRLTEKTTWITMKNIPIFSGLISVAHQSAVKTVFTNEASNSIIWRAMFQGVFKNIKIDGQKFATKQYLDEIGQVHSYVDVAVKATATKEAVAFK